MPKSKLSLGQTKPTDASTVVAATKSATKNSLHTLDELNKAIGKVFNPTNRNKLRKIYALLVDFYPKYQHANPKVLSTVEFARDFFPIADLISSQAGGKKLFVSYSGDGYNGPSEYLSWYFYINTNLGSKGDLAFMKQYAAKLKHRFENPPRSIGIQVSISDFPLATITNDTDTNRAVDTIPVVDKRNSTTDDSGNVSLGDTTDVIFDTSTGGNILSPPVHTTLDTTPGNPQTPTDHSTPKPNDVVDGFDSDTDWVDETQHALNRLALDTTSPVGDAVDQALVAPIPSPRRSNLQTPPTPPVPSPRRNPPSLQQIGRQNAVDYGDGHDDNNISDASWEEIPDVEPFQPLNPTN